MIPPELVTFVQSGVSALIGTRDARLVPECQRALGARVDDPEHLVVYVPCATGAISAENARTTGRVAATFSRVQDHYTIQLKGAVTQVREAREDERETIERYRNGLAETLAFVGLPPGITLRMAHWPCYAIRFRVESIFVQTPGPGAGQPLVVAGGGAPR